MKPLYSNGQWAVLHDKTRANYTGHIRKRRGRWWFFGDVCRDIKGPIHRIIKNGGSIQIP